MPLLSSLLAAALLASSSLVAVNDAQRATVLRVIDGDTIDVRIGRTKEKVRIIGVDTPETVDTRSVVQCFGKEASAQLKTLLHRKTVTLKADPAQDRDVYKRLLRYVELKGKDIGAQMIGSGHAYSYKKYPHPRLESYNALESSAREGKKGLWGACIGGTMKVKNSSSSSSKSAQPSPSATCTIKGNISASREKIYHLKSCNSYSATNIDTTAGERWFCNEQEAREAGWRKAGNC